MVTRPVAEGALATAAVEIVAELERFEPELRAKLLLAIRRVANDAEKEFDRAGARSGRAFADAAGKVAGSSSAFDDVAKSAEKMSRAATKAGDQVSKSFKQPLSDVQRLEAAVRKAADTQSDSAGRIRVAEQQLAEIRANANAKLSDVIAAEERLATARRKGDNDLAHLVDLNKRLTSSQDESTRSTGRFASAFSKIAAPFQKVGSLLANTGLGKQVAKDFQKIGDAAGGGFLSGLQGVISTPVVGPIILGTLLAVAEAVAAPIGAVLAGGIVSVFGGGIAALGIAFAAQAKGVGHIWSLTLSQMAAQLTVLSAPFQTTLETIAHQASSTFAQLAPALGRSFKQLAPQISNFSGQFAQALGRLGPTISNLSASFGTVLQSLGPSLAGTIATIGAALDRLAGSVQKNPTALADFVTGIGNLTALLLDMIRVFNDANGAVERLTGGFSLVDALFAGIGVVISGVLGPLILLAKGIAIVADGLNALKGGGDNSANGLSKAADNVVKLAQGMQGTAGASATAIAGLNGTGTAAESAATKFARQKAVTDGLIASMFRLQNLALGLSGAQINFQAAIDSATASIKENGRTLDISTAKGQANRSALNQVAQAANAQTQALIESGAGLGSAAASANSSRASFIRLAQQMGLGKQAAQALAIQLIGIPNVSREARLTANKKDLDAKLAAAKRELADPSITKERRAQLTATIAQLERQVRAAKAALATVKDKNVQLTVTQRFFGSTVGGIPAGIKAPGRERGGDVAKGQPYVVGEKRAELFVPDQNGTILPRVPSLAAAGAFGAGLAVALHGAGGDAIAGLVGALSAGVPAVTAAGAAVAGAVIGAVRSRLDMHSPSKVMEQAGRDAVDGLINGVRERIPNLRAVLVALSKALPDQVSAAVGKVNTALGGIGKALTSSQRTTVNQFIATARTGIASLERAGTTVSANLKKANSDLVALLTKAQEFAGQVVSTILQTGNITQSQDTSFAGIVKTLTSAVTGAKQFQSVLTALGKAGLDKTLLQQIAEAGPTTGLAVGQSILAAGRAGITQVNKLQGQLQASANQAATAAATALFGQGIKVAQGVVAGFQRQKKQLDAQMIKLADVLVARLLSVLRASKVVRTAGGITIPGFAGGGLIRRPTIAAFAEDGPEVAIPLSKPRRRDELLDRYFGGWADQRAWNGGPGYGGRTKEIHMPIYAAAASAEQIGDVVDQRLTSRGFTVVRGIDTSRGRL